MGIEILQRGCLESRNQELREEMREEPGIGELGIEKSQIFIEGLLTRHRTFSTKKKHPMRNILMT